MVLRDLAFIGVLLGGAVLMAGFALRPLTPPRPRPQSVIATNQPLAILDAVNESLRASWREAGLVAAPPADDLARMRRLTLALTGTIPAIEEVRRFEALPEAGRVDAWLEEILRDRRCADYLAERLARAFVGTEDGPFLVFRRRRFTTWLSDALLENRPYDAIVRDLLTESGLWTDHPATNFVTVTYDQEKERPDPERLAARFSRCFLGARIDCAQCHDHPFESWKQDDFRGLAAFFGGLHSNLRGIREGESDYRPVDRETNEPIAAEPAVPFQADLLPNTGQPRERLAQWLLDSKNPHFARATVNRFWALLFGRPLSEPIDDLPPEADQPELLKMLADDFSAHGHDLHRLIRVMARCEAFQRDSAVYEPDGPTPEQEAAWAVFPITALRPEQVAGGVYQCASLATIGPRSSWVVRFIAYADRGNFVRRYGDTGEDEFNERAGTIPQRLLLMNGELVRKQTQEGLFNAATLIAGQAPNDATAVEVAFLAVLTRRPTPTEASHFTARLAGTTGDTRVERLDDLFWTLLNTTEFSWNH